MAERPRQAPAAAVLLPWDDYLGWLGGKVTSTRNAAGDLLDLGPPLEPGQHMPGIGPTGCAKTTHMAGYATSNRRYVLALDPKGEDETLSASGYIRVKSIPATGWRRMVGDDQKKWRQIEDRHTKGLPTRVIIGGGARTDQEDVALQKLMRDAITYARHSGGWTLLVDEFELLSSQRMFRLGPMIERMLITARRDRTSVLTTYQAPAWVSQHATRQARKVVVYPQSLPMVKSIAEQMNRNWRELAAALDELPDFYSLTVGRGPQSGPMVITKAPKL